MESKSALLFKVVDLPSAGIAIPEWFLDTPKDGIPSERIGQTHFRLRGWVFPGSARRTGMAVRADGVTRAYALNEHRGDVMMKRLDMVPAERPDFLCGFDVKLRECDQFDFGLDLDGRLVWLKRLCRLDGADSAARG